MTTWSSSVPAPNEQCATRPRRHARTRAFEETASPDLASLRVWLFAIARNVVDHSRRLQARPWMRHLVEPSDVESAAGASPDPSDRLLRAWVVEEALRRIGSEHRHAIVETYLRDRPCKEVAEDLGIPVATLRTRVFYALKALPSRWTRWR